MLQKMHRRRKAPIPSVNRHFSSQQTHASQGYIALNKAAVVEDLLLLGEGLLATEK